MEASDASSIRRLRWTAFVLAVLAYMLSYFHRMAPATISADLMRDFQSSATALGTLAATYFYVYTLMQVPTGILADTLGPRRILLLGGVTAGIGSILFGWAPNLEWALFGRTLAGLGVSVVFISMLKLNALWFRDREFATVSGLSILLGNIGAVLAGAPLAWAVATVDWRSLFIGLGLFSILLGVVSGLLVRNAPAVAVNAHPSPDPLPWSTGLRRVVSNRATWPGFWVNVGISGTYFTFAGLWAVPYLRAVHGFSRETAANHTSLLMLGFALGALIVGTWSDRIGRRKPLLLGLSLAYTACWLPWLWGGALSPLASYGLMLVMGLCSAAFTLTWACAKEVNPPALSGMATSVVNTGAFLGTGLLQPLLGWILDQSGPVAPLTSYRPVIGVLLLMALLGCIGAWRTRETWCRSQA